MNRKFTVDIRLTKENGSYTAAALIEDSNGNEIDIITFSSPFMTKAGIMYSCMVKAGKVVAENGGQLVNVKTNFLPLWKDFKYRNRNFPLYSLTNERLQGYGVKVKNVKLVEDRETPVMR